MPGYILHLTEANRIVRKLNQKGIYPPDAWINAFCLGCLLPDTRKKKEKITSHFWDPSTLDREPIPPDLNRFLSLYRKQLTGPLMLGYWVHLHLDERYVQDFWGKVFEFRDAKGNAVDRRDQIDSVWLKKKQKSITLQEMFSSAYYYGDYTRMNASLVKRFGLKPPVYEPVDCPVKEVDPADLQQVLEELEWILARQEEAAREELQVFELEELVQFVEETADQVLPMILRDFGKNLKMEGEDHD